MSEELWHSIPDEYFATSLCRDEFAIPILAAIADDSPLLPVLARLADHVCRLQDKAHDLGGCCCDSDDPGDVCMVHKADPKDPRGKYERYPPWSPKRAPAETAPQDS